MALLRLALPAAVVTIAWSVIGGVGALEAQRLTQDEALELAFPDAEVERRTAFLTEAQLSHAAQLAGPEVEIEMTIVTYYVARRDGMPLGVAYFDAHRVRTLDQVLMVVVEPGGGLGRIETLSFREPPEYESPGGWLRLFDRRALDDELRLRRAIPNITGATLTAGAVTSAVRRVLGLHAVIDPLADARRSPLQPSVAPSRSTRVRGPAGRGRSRADGAHR